MTPSGKPPVYSIAGRLALDEETTYVVLFQLRRWVLVLMLAVMVCMVWDRLKPVIRRGW